MVPEENENDEKRESYHTIPVIQVVEQQIQFVPQFKTSSFRDDAVIFIVELSCKPTKHPSNGKVILMMAVETCWVKHHYRK